MGVQGKRQWQSLESITNPDHPVPVPIRLLLPPCLLPLPMSLLASIILLASPADDSVVVGKTASLRKTGTALFTTASDASCHGKVGAGAGPVGEVDGQGELEIGLTEDWEIVKGLCVGLYMRFLDEVYKKNIHNIADDFIPSHWQAHLAEMAMRGVQLRGIRTASCIF
ncbi:hypothetical protein BT96DRAFT_1013301 [Gymnopus androsaceus JB14]|uniref:Uncharacterized protein n=1 Tax=Gymnopus androsaceus JB14 TaxID=1447944 RepID=A0A6A4IDN4_9AGAR|nr:hypothetical protein BT96DRAFT_1013301 [Gymnopus androsaceus JB14]